VSKSVVPKLIRAVTQIKVAIMSYYPQYFAVIAHNTKTLWFWFFVNPRRIAYYPQFRNHWSKLKKHWNEFKSFKTENPLWGYFQRSTNGERVKCDTCGSNSLRSTSYHRAIASVEAERPFSACGLFAAKLRSCLNGSTTDALFFVRNALQEK